MSNTAIQMKSHSGKSAGNKTKHNERKDNHIKNPNFQILYKDNLHKFHYKEPVQKPKTTQKRLDVEKGLKGQIATLNAKINTYSKRVQEYEARQKPNLKQIDKLKAKIDDLKLQKEKIPQQQDKRGRPITKRYVEFEFSLTNSNHNKHDKRVQEAFIKSVNELKQQNPIFQYLKPTSDIMHLDQESLHVHNINKIMSKKSLTSILKELDPQKSNRNFLSNMQNQFNSIVRQNMRELGLEVERQQKGIKYLPLTKYKEKTNFKSQDQKLEEQAQPKQEIKKEKNIDKLIERQEQRQQEQKEQKEQKQQPQQQPIKKQKEEDKEQDFDFDNLADKIKTTNNKVTKSSNLSAFEAQKKRLREKFKEILENQKENQNETQNAKEQEKSNSKKHYRSR